MGPPRPEQHVNHMLGESEQAWDLVGHTGNSNEVVKYFPIYAQAIYFAEAVNSCLWSFSFLYKTSLNQFVKDK